MAQDLTEETEEQEPFLLDLGVVVAGDDMEGAT